MDYLKIIENGINDFDYKRLTFEDLRQIFLCLIPDLIENNECNIMFNEDSKHMWTYILDTTVDISINNMGMEVSLQLEKCQRDAMPNYPYKGKFDTQFTKYYEEASERHAFMQLYQWNNNPLAYFDYNESSKFTTTFKENVLENKGIIAFEKELININFQDFLNKIIRGIHNTMKG